MMTEAKFLITRATADGVREWARARLEPDAHGHGPFGDHYRTTTLYFDTPDFDVYHRRGSFGRSKYRIRRYNRDHLVFLERKLRQTARLSKRRTLVRLDELAQLSGSDAAWDGAWFQRRLELRGLLPVCQITYDRIARSAKTSAGLVRLTLDDDLRAITRSQVGFDNDRGCPILPDQLILEVKYVNPAPALVLDLLDEFALMPVGLSKYRRAAAVLGLDREDAVGEPAFETAVPIYA